MKLTLVKTGQACYRIKTDWKNNCRKINKNKCNKIYHLFKIDGGIKSWQDLEPKKIDAV
jgi:hypothetical protein